MYFVNGEYAKVFYFVLAHFVKGFPIFHNVFGSLLRGTLGALETKP